MKLETEIENMGCWCDMCFKNFILRIIKKEKATTKKQKDDIRERVELIRVMEKL